MVDQAGRWHPTVGFYSYLVTMIIGLAIIAGSLMVSAFDARLMPLVMGITILVLAGIGLAGEVSPRLNRGGAAALARNAGKESAKLMAWSGYGIALAWMAGFVVGIYVIGVMPSAFLFMVGYMGSHRVKWPVVSISTAVMLAAIYWGFEVTLKIELPRGLLLGWAGI